MSTADRLEPVLLDLMEDFGLLSRDRILDKGIGQFTQTGDKLPH
jgi:hypothetical protein